MSGIQNDNEVLEGKRKGLVDIEAPLRDQIDQKLLAKLKDDKFAEKVVEIWNRANGERSERLQRRQTYLSDWDNFADASSDGPYEGTSNLHVPVTLTVLKTYHARILQALLSNMPAPKARRPDSIEREKVVEEIMKYAVKDWANEYDGIDSVLDSWVFEWCAYGSGTLKSRWECKYEKFIDVVTEHGQETRFVAGPDGNEAAVQVPTSKEVEKERVIKIFEGPQADFVPEEDFVCVGGEGDPQKADLLAHQQWMTASELWTLADRKIFDVDAVKTAIKGGDNPKARDLAGNIKQQKEQASGQSQIDTTTDKDRYQWIEVYTSYDVDGNGIGSEIVAWIHPKSCEIARATYLRRINKSGKRPFFTAEFFRRPGASHPIGLVEMIHPLAKEIDAIHNMRIDAGMFSTMPFFFYRSGSSLKPEIIKYEPGAGIPLDDPQRDVYFPNLGNRTSWGMQEEQAIQTMIERLTGISDMNLGVMTGAQGATRTATGARAMMGESNSNLDVHLKRLYRAWKQYLSHLLSMLQQRIPPGLSYRIVGDDGQDYWGWIAHQDQLAGDFDFSLDPSSADSNPQVRAEKAQNTLNLVMNPLLIQLGVVTPKHVFEAAKGMFIANGIKEYTRYIQAPPQDQWSPSPEEEANRLLRGIQVPVQMNSDHKGFIEYFQFIMKKPEILGQFSKEAVQVLAAQAQKHQQMQAALEQMQAQANNAMQMRQNAQQSQQQAPAAMNPMAGANNSGSQLPQ
jgi:hypothetical protein